MGTQNGRILWCTAELQKAVQKEKPLISQGLLDFFRHYWIVKWGGVNRTGYIKIMVDRKKQNGMYWLIGSQKFHLMKGITESLAGRVAIVDLLGLSQAELDGRADLVDPFMPTPEWIDRAHANLKRPWSLTDVYDRIWRGAFPHVNEENGADRDRFYRSYVQTYIQRDVLRAVIFSFISRKAFTACGYNKSIVVHDNQTCCAFFKSSCSNADAIRSTSRLLR